MLLEGLAPGLGSDGEFHHAGRQGEEIAISLGAQGRHPAAEFWRCVTRPHEIQDRAGIGAASAKWVEVAIARRTEGGRRIVGRSAQRLTEQQAVDDVLSPGLAVLLSQRAIDLDLPGSGQPYVGASGDAEALRRSAATASAQFVEERVADHRACFAGG